MLSFKYNKRNTVNVNWTDNYGFLQMLLDGHTWFGVKEWMTRYYFTLFLTFLLSSNPEHHTPSYTGHRRHKLYQRNEEHIWCWHCSKGDSGLLNPKTDPGSVLIGCDLHVWLFGCLIVWLSGCLGCCFCCCCKWSVWNWPAHALC